MIGQTNRGLLIVSFDAQRPIKKIRVVKGRTSIIYESPFQYALPAGEHSIEIEWEENGLVNKLTREISVTNGETREFTLDEFLAGR